MAIVPTGRVRLMEKQAVAPADIMEFNPKLADGQMPQSRNDIEQQQIGQGEQNGQGGTAKSQFSNTPVDDQNSQAGDQSNTQPNPQDPGTFSNEQVQNPQMQQQPKEQVHKVNTAQMKDHYFQEALA